MPRDDDPEMEIDTVTRKGAAAHFGKYKSLGRIGQGGMAEVFLAVGRGPAGFNKLVVIKRLRDTVASDDAFRDMFLDEARLAARLNHPNVVQTYEVFEDAEAFFITMEYLEGQPLGRITRECGKRGAKLDAKICARLISDVLCGLHYAHDACDFDGTPLHIVHRDVSPQNIFVTYDGQVKVVDFGIAKAEVSSTKTQAGFFKGKAAYMAPEQLEGGAIDRRVDVFTTGIVLWELLAGKKLMAAETTAKTLLRLVKEPIPLVTEVVENVDPELAEIARRALERDPAARYQTAGEMRDALERYLVHCHAFVRQEDIGRIVADTFAEHRAERQRIVGEQMALTSVLPPSGAQAAAGAAAMPEGTAPGVDAPQLASMSGISVSRTVSALVPARPVFPGASPEIATPKPRRLAPVAAALIAALSVAAMFVFVGRTRPGLTSPPPAAALPAVQPPVQQPSAQLPAATIVVPPAEPPRPDSPPQGAQPVGAPPAPPPSRLFQPSLRARPQPVEAKQVTQPSRASTSPATPSHESSTPAAAPSAAAEAEPVRPPQPATTPPPAPPPTPTQEGRKFRTSL